MNRRHFSCQLTWGLSATAYAAWAGGVGLLTAATAQAAEAPTPPAIPEVQDPQGVGLRTMLEVTVTQLFARHPDGWPPTLNEHLRERWANWQRFGPRPLSEGSPWSRFEAFESLARHASKTLWGFAHDDLRVQAHKLGESDLKRMREASVQVLSDTGGWVTAAFEQVALDHLHHRLVGAITDLHLQWRLLHADRYPPPRNPAARHAQIEVEDSEICSRVTRALTFAIFDGLAEEERRLRQDPKLAGTHVPLKQFLTQLGPAPKGALPTRTGYGGAVKDPLQPADLKPAPAASTTGSKRPASR